MSDPEGHQTKLRGTYYSEEEYGKLQARVAELEREREEFLEEKKTALFASRQIANGILLDTQTQIDRFRKALSDVVLEFSCIEAETRGSKFDHVASGSTTHRRAISDLLREVPAAGVLSVLKDMARALKFIGDQDKHTLLGPMAHTVLAKHATLLKQVGVGEKDD